jgi:hypothetical protein
VLIRVKVFLGARDEINRARLLKLVFPEPKTHIGEIVLAGIFFATGLILGAEKVRRSVGFFYGTFANRPTRW